jgi:hypothetical protein
VQALCKSAWRLLQKLKADLPPDPAGPFLGTYPKECESTYTTDTRIPMFIAALFTTFKLWNQLRHPTTYE